MARFTALETAAASPGGVANVPPARAIRSAAVAGTRMPNGHAVIGRGEKK
jgi:hypothetical protein